MTTLTSKIHNFTSPFQFYNPLHSVFPLSPHARLRKGDRRYDVIRHRPRPKLESERDGLPGGLDGTQQGRAEHDVRPGDVEITPVDSRLLQISQVLRPAVLQVGSVRLDGLDRGERGTLAVEGDREVGCGGEGVAFLAECGSGVQAQLEGERDAGAEFDGEGIADAEGGSGEGGGQVGCRDGDARGGDGVFGSCFERLTGCVDDGFDGVAVEDEGNFRCCKGGAGLEVQSSGLIIGGQGVGDPLHCLLDDIRLDGVTPGERRAVEVLVAVVPQLRGEVVSAAGAGEEVEVDPAGRLLDKFAGIGEQTPFANQCGSVEAVLQGDEGVFDCLLVGGRPPEGTSKGRGDKIPWVVLDMLAT